MEMKILPTLGRVGVVWRILKFAHVETTVCACRFKDLAEPVVLFSELQRFAAPVCLRWTRGYLPHL